MADKGNDVAEITPEWAAVMEVLRAAYELGMSGDPAETTDPEQIKRRLGLVNACEAMQGALTAIVEERDALAEEVARMRVVLDRVQSTRNAVTLAIATNRDARVDAKQVADELDRALSAAAW